MNRKRVVIATTIGALCGIYCAGSIAMTPDPGFPLTTGMLAMYFYGRLLIGFFVGIGDNIKLHPAIRGASLGAILSLAISMVPLVDGALFGGLLLVIFGIIYGIIADVVATKLSK